MLFNNNQSQDFRANVINNPHILDWFFMQRTEQFVIWWLYNSLGAQWQWYKYEFAIQRGSIHCHGVAKLASGPDLCGLTIKRFSSFEDQRNATLDLPNIGRLIRILLKDLKQKEKCATILAF